MTSHSPHSGRINHRRKLDVMRGGFHCTSLSTKLGQWIVKNIYSYICICESLLLRQSSFTLSATPVILAATFWAAVIAWSWHNAVSVNPREHLVLERECLPPGLAFGCQKCCLIMKITVFHDIPSFQIKCTSNAHVCCVWSFMLEIPSRSHNRCMAACLRLVQK